MTLSDDDFRDFAALAVMINISKQIDWQYAIDPALAKHVANQAFDLADAMLDESRRRKKADREAGKDDPDQWNITRLNLSVRALNGLELIGCRTVGDITKFSEHDLLGCRNIGKTTIYEIKEELEKHGLYLSRHDKLIDRIGT